MTKLLMIGDLASATATKVNTIRFGLGAKLAETERFRLDSQMAVADIDIERLQLERMRTGTFNEAAIARQMPDRGFRRVKFRSEPPAGNVGFERCLDRFPFVPDDPARLDEDCFEAFNIQVTGPDEAARGDRDQAGLHRNLRRPRLDPCVDRCRSRLRPARAAALGHPRLHHAGLRHE